MTHPLPARVLDLTRWKLQLPVGTPGSPNEVKHPMLATFSAAPFFYVPAPADRVTFRVHADAPTTPGTRYGRCELAERTADGKANAAWSSAAGTHTMRIVQAITHLPDVKRHLVAGQLHDGADDVAQIRLEGSRLFVAAADADDVDLEPRYALGTVFTVELVVADDVVSVLYDGVRRARFGVRSDTLRYKCGCYPQTNLDKGDLPGSYGQVDVLEVAVTHADR